MRVIVRKERPHPGAQLRLTDPDGHRYTAFATNTRPGGPHRQLADLELRHRRRARAEDRIRAAKDTGLTNLPLHELDQNRIWQAVVALACDITAWTQCSPSPSTRRAAGNPNGSGCGCSPCPPTLARHARRVVLHLPAHAPWAELVLDGLTGSARSPSPADPTRPSRRPKDPNRTVEPAPPERPRPNCHTQQAKWLITPASTSVLTKTAPQDERSVLVVWARSLRGSFSSSPMW